MPSEMLAAALSFAERGWPVFPCHRETKRPLVGGIPGEPKSGGLKRATTTREIIETWWKKYPLAMIGVPTGPPIGAFVVDFDAGIDDSTGEVFAGVDLSLALEAELGVTLPETLIVDTPRGGGHAYFQWPPDIEIGNRAGIIRRVDVRGDGGYVIVPPSFRVDGGAYRWRRDSVPIATPPPALLDLILRRGRWARNAQAHEKIPGAERLEKYALAAFMAEMHKVESAPDGARNATLNEAAFSLGQLVGADALPETMVRSALTAAAGRWPNLQKSIGTIDSGLSAGKDKPRDLKPVLAASSTRRSRPAGAASGEAQRSGTPRLRVVGGGRDVPLPVEEAPYVPEGDELRSLGRQARRRDDPPAAEPRNGVKAGKTTPDRLGLPREDPCPVIPLGQEGAHFYFLDSSRQLVKLNASQFTHAGIQALFAAAPNWPKWAFPRFGRARKAVKEGEPDELPIESFKDDDVRDAMFLACARKGLFSVEDRVRGRGGWKLADGALLYHAGEELWLVEGGLRARETGLIDDAGHELVYPRRAALPPPWPVAVTPADNPARQLIEVFRKFNWENPVTAPVLLLGWIGVAYLGGALDWRSAVFLIGDRNTGKSTLQRMIKDLFGDALLDSANATAASIYQALGQDARPVAVDEMEASADNRRMAGIIELAKDASSGAIGRRGSSDSGAQGVEFQMRSAFLFSAINNPPLASQVLSRLAILRLRDLPEGNDTAAAPTILNADRCGRMVLSRLMHEWHRFPATLAAYKQVLAAGGHSNRGEDTYGTLLACADLILGPELAEELGIPMVDNLGAWSEILHVSTLPEVGDALKNWRACLNHLLQSHVAIWRSGERATVGQLLEDFFEQGSQLSVKYVQRQLGSAGLGLLNHQKHGYLLAVPQNSAALETLFRGSPWQGVPGTGAWSEAIRQVPDELKVKFADNRLRIASSQPHCVFIRYDKLVEL